MTAIATLLALMPLVLGFSEGSIIASELGTVVVGGLFTSTFLTLIVVPVAYSLLDGLRNKLGGGPKPSELNDLQDEDGPVQAQQEPVAVS
jgi:HAE1 family hydrophobic/amphiphilic exporter-1